MRRVKPQHSKDNMKLSPDKKLAGVLCPVFAIRTETDLGIGDTEGVRQMIDWCHKHGFGVLQILPINETSDDNSPYNAISSLALEPTTMAISPDHIPDLSAAKFKSIAPTDLLTELREGSVNYTRSQEAQARPALGSVSVVHRQTLEQEERARWGVSRIP